MQDFQQQRRGKGMDEERKKEGKRKDRWRLQRRSCTPHRRLYLTKVLNLRGAFSDSRVIFDINF